MHWQNLFYIALLILVGGLLISYIRKQPGAFSRENLTKGFWVLGILALFLMAVVGFLIVLARI